MLIKIKEIENSKSNNALNNLKKVENKFKNFLKKKLLTFPINCIEIKNGKNDTENLEIHIQLDNILRSQFFYNQIAHYLFRKLEIDFLLFEKKNPKNPNLDYYFYGEKKILNFYCSILLDISN